MRNVDTFSLFESHSGTFHVVFALQTCRLFKPEALEGVFNTETLDFFHSSGCM